MAPVSVCVNGHSIDVAAPGVRWRVMPIELRSARDGRAYALEFLAPRDGDERPVDGEHLDDVAAVVGELVANACQATTKAPKPPPGVLPAVWLGVHVTARFTHILVRDAVPVEPAPREPYEDPETGDWHGYGLGIVEALCAAWWTVMRDYDKTVHAVVARPGVTPSREELEALRR